MRLYESSQDFHAHPLKGSNFIKLVSKHSPYHARLSYAPRYAMICSTVHSPIIHYTHLLLSIFIYTPTQNTPLLYHFYTYLSHLFITYLPLIYHLYTTNTPQYHTFTPLLYLFTTLLHHFYTYLPHFYHTFT